MSEGYDPRFRPMVIWRWLSTPSREHILWALDQARTQELGGVIIAPPSSPVPHAIPPCGIEGADAAGDPIDRLLAYAIAEGGARGLMMWVALPDPPAALNPLHPQQVQGWLNTHWAPRLTGTGAISGLSGILLNAVRPPIPVAGQAWDELFTEAFLDQKGYLPKKVYAKLTQTLVDVYDVYTTLLAASWYGVVGEWCDEFDLTLIASVANAARPIAMPDPVGKYLAQVDIPALSLPIHHHEPLLEKIIHSAAVLNRRPRTAALLQSGPLADYSLDNLKRIAERLVVAGIDMFIVDGFGALGPSTGLSYQMPQWPHVHLWSRYCGMLCETFSEGQDIARVALLDPATSSVARADDLDARSVAAQFESLRTELDDAQVAYVIVDEASCARFTAVEGRLFVRELWFDALIVPPMTHLCEDTVIALRRLGDQSRIFAFGAGDVEVIAIAGQAEHKAARRVSLRSTEGLLFTYGDTLRRSDVFWHAIAKTVTLSSGAGIRWRRVHFNGADWCLGVNEGAPRTVTAALASSGSAALYNDATDTFGPAPMGPTSRPDTLELVLDLKDQAAVLLRLDDSPASSAHRFWNAHSRIDIPGPWQCTPHDGNMLRIRHWPFQITLRDPVAHIHVLGVGIPESTAIQLDGIPLVRHPWDADPDASVFTRDDRVPAGLHHLTRDDANAGLAWLLGDFAVLHTDPTELAPVPDVRPGPWEERGFPDFSGAATYIAEIEVPADHLGAECQLVVPGAGGIVELEVNGHTAAIRPWPPYRAPVTKLLRAGSNLISITLSNALSNMMSGPDTEHPSGLVETPFLEFGTWSRPEE